MPPAGHGVERVASKRLRGVVASTMGARERIPLTAYSFEPAANALTFATFPTASFHRVDALVALLRLAESCCASSPPRLPIIDAAGSDLQTNGKFVTSWILTLGELNGSPTWNFAPCFGSKI